MGKKLYFLLVILTVSFIPTAFADSDSLLEIKEDIEKDKLKELLLVADQFENQGRYIEAYQKYTQVGKMATEAGNFDFASEIYLKAITIRKIYDLKIPFFYSDRNLAYLNLCKHLRQTHNEKSTFWHLEGIKQSKEDKDTLTLLKLYKSFTLDYINKYENQAAINVIEKALPISLAFRDTVEYAINLLDYSDLLNKEGKYAAADSVAYVGYKLIHDYEITNKIKHSTKWSFWFIQLKAFIYFNEGELKKSEQYFRACVDSINNFEKSGGVSHADLFYVTNIRLGKLYYALGNYLLADEYFIRAEEILNNPNNVGFNRVFLYDNMVQTYQKAGLYKKAYETSEKYRKYIGDLNKKAQKQHNLFLKDIAERDIESAKNQIQNLKREATLKEQDVKMTYLAIGIFAVGIIALLLLFFFQRQNKTNRQLLIMNKTIGEQRDEITASIEYAKKIQKAILPSNELMKICLPFSYVYYRPRDIVSGDFYWVHTIGEKVLVACADSTGHGVPGAIVSMIGNNGLDTCVNEYGLSKPAQILDALNKYVEETFEKSSDTVNDGMDIALCLFDFAENTVEYSGANIPLYMVSNANLMVIKPDKQPIGRYEYRQPFTNHKLSLDDVDNIYICSDGLQDQFGGAKGKKFKIKRLKRLLVELSQQDINKQKGMLNDTFMDWKEGEDQVDDVCFIGIHTGKRTNPLNL